MELHVSFAGALQTGLDQCAVPVSLENDRATPTPPPPSVSHIGGRGADGGGRRSEDERKAEAATGAEDLSL
ncbi:hypothetical protein CKAH01_00417 [Colletotrichum kahawae]|uniref:Uncharacterized protein n=1 Tax=Colletotrichum kahawae TaxID=34407 RepID=A0AAD9YYD6_COLKA|nr:hypothetical protein CKAH01_00417 [Colletotrichum kahawae]